MTRLAYHPAVLDEDLLRMEAALGDPQGFAECLNCLEQGLRAVLADPLGHGAPLPRVAVVGYRTLKLHAVRRPPRHRKPDVRVVYRWDPATETVFVEGIGLRQPRAPQDVYAQLTDRPLSPPNPSERRPPVAGWKSANAWGGAAMATTVSGTPGTNNSHDH